MNLRGTVKTIFDFSKNRWWSKGTPESSEFLKYTPIGEYSDNLGQKNRARHFVLARRSLGFLVLARGSFVPQASDTKHVFGRKVPRVRTFSPRLEQFVPLGRLGRLDEPAP